MRIHGLYTAETKGAKVVAFTSNFRQRRALFFPSDLFHFSGQCEIPLSDAIRLLGGEVDDDFFLDVEPFGVRFGRCCD